jgi:hypothetical protein
MEDLLNCCGIKPIRKPPLPPRLRKKKLKCSKKISVTNLDSKTFFDPFAVTPTRTLFRVPSGTYKITVWEWGGGGGGSSSGGGGGGAFAFASFDVRPGTKIRIITGNGGQPGTAGGNTSVTIGSRSLIAGGGQTAVLTNGGLGGIATSSNVSNSLLLNGQSGTSSSLSGEYPSAGGGGANGGSGAYPGDDVPGTAAGNLAGGGAGAFGSSPATSGAPGGAIIQYNRIKIVREAASSHPSAL